MLDYATVADAADIADVTPQTIRVWIKEGRLNAYQRGGRRPLLIRLSELEATMTPARVSVGERS